MTVESTVNRVDYTGDGVTTGPYLFDFRVDDEDWFTAYVAGAVVTQSNYTLNLNADQQDNPGGDVTFNVAPADQDSIVLIREVPETQETDYGVYDSFPSQRLEEDLDKAVMLIQQLQEQVDRAYKVPIDGVTPPEPASTVTGDLLVTGNVASNTSTTVGSASVGGDLTVIGTIIGDIRIGDFVSHAKGSIVAGVVAGEGVINTTVNGVNSNWMDINLSTSLANLSAYVPAPNAYGIAGGNPPYSASAILTDVDTITVKAFNSSGTEVNINSNVVQFEVQDYNP